MNHLELLNDIDSSLAKDLDKLKKNIVLKYKTIYKLYFIHFQKFISNLQFNNDQKQIFSKYITEQIDIIKHFNLELYYPGYVIYYLNLLFEEVKERFLNLYDNYLQKKQVLP